MYDKQVVRRRRAALAVLVVLSLGLLTVYFGEGPSGVLHGLQRGTQSVLGPIETGMSRATKPFRDLVGWVGDNLNAKGENDRLKKENAQLRGQLTKTQVAAQNDAEYRKLLNLPKNPAYPQGTDPLVAQVRVYAPTFWYSTVTINKGTADGVRVNQAVVAPDGLAGRVTAVTGGTATVTLITDSESSVSAMVLPTTFHGNPSSTGFPRAILQPDVGNPEQMKLDFIKSDKIQKGDIVITAGSTSDNFESYFPKGIPIGRITRADPDTIASKGEATVQPFVNVRELDTVQVLRAKPANSTNELAPNGIAGGSAPKP
jgi:rod shape-determining protein MreC